MLKQQKIFFDFLRFCIGSEKDIHTSFEESGLEGAVSYRPEAGFAWCAVLWFPAVAKGVCTRAEAADAMDGNGGTDSKTEYQTVSEFRKGLPELRERGLC